MKEDLISIIEELKSLSGGRVTNTPTPDEVLISEYESDIDFIFPEEYKYFLMEASNVLFGTKDPLVITRGKSDRSELSSALREGREMGVPADWLPICEDNGDYYCIVPDGRIIFWPGNGATNESWPDIATWIKEVWIGES